MRAIAELNGFYYGSGVYEARAMLDTFIVFNRLIENDEKMMMHGYGDFIISPNPASGQIQFLESESSRPVIDHFLVELYDASGRLIQQFEVMNGLADVSFLENGTYILKVKSDAATATYSKLIIIK